MALEIRLPQLSDEMAEGLVSHWLKQVGDEVKKGEPILEVETEKVIVEVEAEADGVLIEIVAAEQETVPVGGLLCRLGEAGKAPASQPTAEVISQIEATPVSDVPPIVPPAASTTTPLVTSSSASPTNVVPLVPPGVVAQSEQPFATPLAQRIATELGIDLSGVRGSGIGGKIVGSDLQPYLYPDHPSGLAPDLAPDVQPELGARETAGATSLARMSQRVVSPTLAAAPAPGPAGRTATPPHVDAAKGQAVPHTPLRRTVARRMTESKQEIPHFYMTVEVDVTGLLKLRGQLNSDPDVLRISVNDLMLKATALTLEQVPEFNAAFTKDAVIRYEAAHIGFAVAIDGGLVTPVVRDCHLKSVGRIARDAAELIARAKARKLRGDDLEGGRFTISNMGMYDVTEFAAIINPPQVGVLAIARPVERAVVVDGQVAVRWRMSCTLSADHRAVDGVATATFLRVFKAILEQPLGLIR